MSSNVLHSLAAPSGAEGSIDGESISSNELEEQFFETAQARTDADDHYEMDLAPVTRATGTVQAVALRGSRCLLYR